MSIHIMSMVWDSDVQAPERFTLLALADRADEDGKCWPSVKWLSRKCQTSERTIRRHLSWLESKGLIRRAVRLNDSSIYRISVRGLAQHKLPVDPCQSDTPGQSDTPDTVTGGASLTGGTDWQGVTDDAVDPCQIDPQYVIDPPLTASTASSSGSSALAPAPSAAPAARVHQDDAPRAEVVALCAHLRDRIRDNGSKAAAGREWNKHARLLLDIDERDLAEAHRLIDWCQDDHFWQGNILSMPTFRRQYDKLRLQAQNSRRLRSVDGHRTYRNPEDQSEYDEPMFPIEEPR
jgi:hypothetical protein